MIETTEAEARRQAYVSKRTELGLPPGAPLVHDRAIDALRPVTQEDFDALQQKVLDLQGVVA